LSLSRLTPCKALPPRRRRRTLHRRVREGADGSWCMKWECKDEKLMQNGILKCLHALPKDIAPGTYLLHKATGTVWVDNVALVKCE